MSAAAAGCGAPTGGAALAGVDLTKEALITGVVSRDAAPVSGAYVRLLDSSGEFTAEVATDDDGVFRFFAGTGEWTVRALAPGNATATGTVNAEIGAVAQVDLALA